MGGLVALGRAFAQQRGGLDQRVADVLRFAQVQDRQFDRGAVAERDGRRHQAADRTLDAGADRAHQRQPEGKQRQRAQADPGQRAP